MAQVERTQITIFSGTLTTDATNTLDATYTGRRIRSLRPPYVLVVDTANAGTAPGGTNLSIAVTLQDSADGTTYANAITHAAITSVGAQSARKSNNGQLRSFVRARATVSAGTWNAGSTITATLTGDGIA